MKEETPRRHLVNALNTFLTGWVALRLEDKFKSGVPDIALTGLGGTSWLEIKLDKPGDPAESEAIQLLTMQRLNAAGLSRYVIFRLEPKQVFIVEPNQFEEWKSQPLFVDGWRYDWILAKLWDLHDTHFRHGRNHR